MRRSCCIPTIGPWWVLTHPDQDWDGDLADGQHLDIGGVRLQVLHTPGHTPGGVCLYAAQLNALFSGDTLFNGGPGATGRSFSDRSELEYSIRSKLFTLPEDTVVHTGHGPDTTLGAERITLG